MMNKEITVKRREAIMALLEGRYAAGIVFVEARAEFPGDSESALREDLVRLEKEGVLERGMRGSSIQWRISPVQGANAFRAMWCIPPGHGRRWRFREAIR